MDTVERILLNTVQTAFPVTSHPYQTLGELAGVSEEEAWQSIIRLREEGIIRRLGGVFDSHRLGYHSTLCAGKVPEAKISEVAEYLNGIPGVTHNYLRPHQYNMWFTIIASTKAEVEKILDKVRQIAGSDEVYSLPAIRLFKISVDFNFKEDDSDSDTAISSSKAPGAWESSQAETIEITERDKALIRLVQGDLPYSLTPFAELAKALKWTEREVLDLTQSMLERGLIRRFGVVLRHQKAGFTANAMGVWPVAEDHAEEIGAKMAEFREVSHCYQRPTLPDWPYTLFTMIHGRSVEDCQNVMERIAQATGVEDYRMLFSQAELKKSSMKYFVEAAID
ncbi:Lrp/AsnC family transcriptional regulator [Desulfitobacterium metallireducens]|uniref:siroheme decarboxylase n=1 Tax=Desulfitobacterium metallireducens DSM 15288 TaxID=871968 RepID=W0EDS0_9FIRM|nr:Lrp/AsnC family transcriptional regulator [Desulfitobacterium metallireducens]AHF07201.1 transcriptional regulator [Desulfitobacterium metallireducens DSM 15288]